MITFNTPRPYIVPLFGLKWLYLLFVIACTEDLWVDDVGDDPASGTETISETNPDTSPLPWDGGTFECVHDSEDTEARLVDE